MTLDQILVTAVGIGGIVFVYWFFLMKKSERWWSMIRRGFVLATSVQLRAGFRFYRAALSSLRHLEKRRRDQAVEDMHWSISTN